MRILGLILFFSVFLSCDQNASKKSTTTRSGTEGAEAQSEKICESIEQEIDSLKLESYRSSDMPYLIDYLDSREGLSEEEISQLAICKVDLKDASDCELDRKLDISNPDSGAVREYCLSDIEKSESRVEYLLYYQIVAGVVGDPGDQRGDGSDDQGEPDDRDEDNDEGTEEDEREEDDDETDDKNGGSNNPADEFESVSIQLSSGSNGIIAEHASQSITIQFVGDEYKSANGSFCIIKKNSNAVGLSIEWCIRTTTNSSVDEGSFSNGVITNTYPLPIEHSLKVSAPNNTALTKTQNQIAGTQVKISAKGVVKVNRATSVVVGGSLRPTIEIAETAIAPPQPTFACSDLDINKDGRLSTLDALLFKKEIQKFDVNSDSVVSSLDSDFLTSLTTDGEAKISDFCEQNTANTYFCDGNSTALYSSFGDAFDEKLGTSSFNIVRIRLNNSLNMNDVDDDGDLDNDDLSIISDAIIGKLTCEK